MGFVAYNLQGLSPFMGTKWAAPAAARTPAPPIEYKQNGSTIEFKSSFLQNFSI